MVTVKGAKILLSIGRALLHVLQSLKDAASDVRLHSALFFSLVGKLAWILPLLLVRHMFRVLPGVYHAFAEAGTEYQWALLLASLMAWDVFAIARKTFWPQVIGLILGAFVWFFFSSFVSQNLPHGPLGLPGTPGGWVYLFCGIGCFVGLFRTAQHHRAEAEADNWIFLARELNRAQSRGEAWAQPTAEKSTAEKSTAEKMLAPGG